MWVNFLANIFSAQNVYGIKIQFLLKDWKSVRYQMGNRASKMTAEVLNCEAVCSDMFQK